MGKLGQISLKNTTIWRHELKNNSLTKISIQTAKAFRMNIIQLD